MRRSTTSRPLVGVLVTVLALLAWAGCSTGPVDNGTETTTSRPAPKVAASGLSKIKHVVVIMQENRSFDSYFGTYPGADGIQRNATGYVPCLPDPNNAACVRPFHSAVSEARGGAHTVEGSVRAIDGGKMDGFVYVERKLCGGAQGACGGAVAESMGYHDAREIPNYWQYAKDYVLQDRMFTSNVGWSLPAHLAMVSGWSALCTTADPSSCVSNNQLYAFGHPVPPSNLGPKAIFAWTDLTHLLYRNHVSWGYYVEPGTEPDCANDAAVCPPVPLSPATPGIWNPLPNFTTVKQNNQLGNVQAVSKFRAAALHGTLPAVSWIVPSEPDSEHPPGTVPKGQAWVTSLINNVMQGPNWDSTAIFVSWDDWGGFYDHVVPPKVDLNGYGIRVPGLLISPYARKGLIDHQTLSHDAYLKLIEDIFLGGARLDPATDGRPDPRPMVREKASILGDLSREFDFTQPPRPPHLLPTKPPPGPASLLPNPPTGVKATPVDGGVQLTWTRAPAKDGLDVTRYVVTPSTPAGTLPRVQVTGASSTATVQGLTNGTAYQFRVTAVNGTGGGSTAPATTAVIAGTPAATAAPTATAGRGSATLSWPIPVASNGAPVIGYVVTPYLAGVALPPILLASPTTATASTHTVTALTAGKRYRFTVAARNSRGMGPPSSLSAAVVPT